MNQPTSETQKSEPSNITQMADIFLPLPPEPVDSIVPLFIEVASVLMVLFFLLFVLWKWFKDPLEKLKRELKQGKFSSREAAHHLAHLMLNNNKNKLSKIFDKKIGKVNQLRFQRQSPDINEVLILIDKVKHDC